MWNKYKNENWKKSEGCSNNFKQEWNIIPLRILSGLAWDESLIGGSSSVPSMGPPLCSWSKQLIRTQE